MDRVVIRALTSWQLLALFPPRNLPRWILSSAPDVRSRALVLSSALPHAGDWLNVVPSTSLDLHLHDKEFRFSLRYWLSIPLYGNAYPCPECRGMADRFGDHQVGCGDNGDHISRHNALRYVLFRATRCAALAPSLVPNSSSHLADILLPNWSQGRRAALDVSVISPMQHLTLSK